MAITKEKKEEMLQGVADAVKTSQSMVFVNFQQVLLHYQQSS